VHTTYQPDTKSNPNPSPNPTTKQHAIVNIQPNIVTCPTYPNQLIQDYVVAPLHYLNCHTAYFRGSKKQHTHKK